MFAAGLIIRYVKYDSSDNFKKFDYSEQDGLFSSSKSFTEGEKNNEKKVDSEQELLDFSKDKLELRKKKSVKPKEKSINLNTADLSAFEALPGIGEKTAQRIINYRSTHGNFSSIEDIMKVKGIGKKKFERIKMYLIIKK
ncbi:MAG: helix-hairpin-helix domain-containing protein [Chlorobi bacterium]|nr:helix-hairpin-helix domain-containing protein [Chlorobiota bacterium]